ncbi:AmmeMemoRadiSam system radical SAM enzyme [Candidatus Xianfuyuplasma coldseepsis]|uniref:AmmeMemoRadiSam system radical SAM enzyme n=1 Tax=Candidatus Xianfuyuplasma coldseepsis TaxID=2782163 RepID=A0A7L7KRN5_9MOLU|nr:AmmeMemoRadiSam system radical SAM enzyme [Xianfuyuplasma coldseepsis]QMS84866.1 AmmeMemoRadiSam system radical SAM enzyme [Xianfuyuplasma coldseepsis]
MESLFYTVLSEQAVHCHVCEHHCVIKDNDMGICGVRKNNNGVLKVLNYNKTISVSIDPIRKKPLYHFLQNTNTYSFAAIGCNLRCAWCQNYSISQSQHTFNSIPGKPIKPQQHVDQAIHYGCPSISYTYSEPTIYVEYALETMKLAHKQGLKNIWVTNGFMSEQTIRAIIPYLDAVNIDYKASSEEIYSSYIGGRPEPILRNMKLFKEASVHIEVTTLIIPGVNDSTKELTSIVEDLTNTLRHDFIWHISRFFPSYKMKSTSPTPMNTLRTAKDIGTSYGIQHIYLGNV